MLTRISDFFEKQTFGVCEWLGKKLGIQTKKVRLCFIYVSFVTFGSPLLLYLAFAFILENKKYFKPGPRRKSVWELE